MKLFVAAIISQLLLLVRGSDVPGEQRRVGCYYLGAISERYGTLYPEDIDTSLCTQVFYIHGAINNETQEIILRPIRRNMKTGGESYVPRLAALKVANPDLKLGLHVVPGDFNSLLQNPAARTNFIRNAAKWLNGTGFDTLEFAAPLGLRDTDKLADFLCEMKTEFDKYGCSVSIFLTKPMNTSEEIMRKIARCCDQVTLVTHDSQWATHRMAPMDQIKPDVSWLILSGVPANKILISVPAYGSIFTLEDPEDTGMGAAIAGGGSDDYEMMNGRGIPNKELLRKMNDSSLGWTIRRDNETQEPYAFTTTGIWTSYEDTTSVKYKANYVMQQGLGGINIVGIDFEDVHGLGGEGKFPLTKAVRNILRGNQSVTS